MSTKSSELGGRLGTQAAAEAQGIQTAAGQKGDPTGLSVLGWINDARTKDEIARALPQGLDPGRFMRQVQTELRRNPKLLDADPRSFILGVLTIAQLGLELGPLGQAYITGPFKVKRGGKELKEAVLIVGYKGLCELAYRAGTVDLIDAVTVHEGEPFKVVRGSEPRIEHEELESASGKKPIAYYAIAAPKGGGRTVFDVMWPEDVEKIRKRSKASADGPWVTDFEAMAHKTVVRRLLNRGRVRLSPQVQEAISEDELREIGVDRELLLQAGMVGDDEDGAAANGAPPATGEAQEPAAAAQAGATAEQTAGATASKQAGSSDPGAAFRPKA